MLCIYGNASYLHTAFLLIHGQCSDINQKHNLCKQPYHWTDTPESGLGSTVLWLRNPNLLLHPLAAFRDYDSLDPSFDRKSRCA